MNCETCPQCRARHERDGTLHPAALAEHPDLVALAREVDRWYDERTS